MASPQPSPSTHVNGDNVGEEGNQGGSSDENSTAPSRIPVPNRMPKKGILKRSTSFGSSRRDNEAGDTIFPLRVDRHSAEREIVPPSAKPSKIPKLSVTWWETNSVCGESPESTRRNRRSRSVDEEEEDDEEESVGSSVGSSQIAGTWWFGRSTRYVPHCERRGHHHHHGDGTECGEYLTPTQRKNRELIELKKQLRTALSQIDDKERHLSQLRERLNELENMMDATAVVSDTHRLMARQKELIYQFEAEKQALTEKYEQRVRQLRQEAADARSEAVKAVALAEQRFVPEKSTVDASAMTEVLIGDSAATIPVSDPGQSVEVYQRECLALRARLNEMEMSLGRQERDGLTVDDQRSNVCIGALCVAQKQEMFAQMQAYQNEALAWRTKAAELEIIVKQRLMTNDPVLLRMMNGSASPTPVDSSDAERYRQECMRLQGYINQLEMERGNREMVDSGIEAQMGPPTPSLLGECIMAQCVAKRRKLTDDNEQLVEQFAEQQTRLQEVEEELMDAKKADAEMDGNLKRLEKRVADVLQQLTSKMAECEAAQLGVQRCQTDNATLRKAVDYLEERNQLLQNTMLDAGLVVHGESTTGWRKGFSNPRSRVDQSKKVQTDLTSESLGNHEKEFVSLHEKLELLEKEFSTERTDLRGRFKEIQENLALKAHLVQTLTKQLQTTNAEIEASAELAEKERQDYSRRLNALSLVAQRVPLLEAELERAQQERLAAERVVEQEREQYQEALDSSLTGSLKQQQDQTHYWQQKLAIVERQHEADKIELKKLQKQHNEIKMRLNLEKVDLEQKLEGTIHQVATLTDKVYRPMDSKEVQVKPDVVNKYVACRPIMKSKVSEIVKGDLFDETEERLKLCQGELLTTRRQVEVLQQKLLDCVQVKEQHREDGTLLKKAHVLETEMKEEKRKSEEALQTLVDANAQLEARLRQIEDEKTAIVWAERDRIAQLAAEFDNVRQELDTEIRKYEAEKRRMKERVAKLELALKDRDELKTRLKRFEAYEQLLVDGPQPLDMRAIESELEMIKQSAQFVVVEPPEEDLAAISRRSSVSTSRDPCVQFLLARLQSERQKYTEDADFLRRKLAETNGECDRLRGVERNESRRSDKPLERTCSDPLLAAPVADNAGDTKAQLRAKNLLLIKDNTKLASELADVRRTVASSINRTVSRRSTVGSLDLHSQAQSSIRSDRSPGFADLASDLNEVRVDLEGILQQIDNATVHQTTAQFAIAAAERSREGRLMQWLEKELEEDKHELDVMTKWYDQDKRRMETDLKLSREDRAELQAQLDRMAVDYHDVCRELELYKQEDASRLLGSSAAAHPAVPPDGRLIRSRSTTDISGCPVDREEHIRWKHKAGTMFRELGRLRHDYKTVDAELRSVQQQLIVQRGETELARAGFIDTTATDDRVAAVSTTASENDASPAKMTERERDLVLRAERLTSHTRALELNADRLRTELRQATIDHEMTKGDLRAAQTNIRALEAQVSALSLRQSSLPKIIGDNNAFQVVCRSRDSDTPSETTMDSDVFRSSTTTFATAKQPSSSSLARLGRLAQSDPDVSFISFRTSSPSNITGALPGRPSIVERLAAAEERANRCEQEYQMAHTELLLLRDATQLQLSALRAERNELKKRLHEAACEAEKMGPSGWDRVEELNAEIDDLRSEVDRMTNERQDMYLIMFKKGQDAAKHEMEIASPGRRESTPSYSGPLKTEHLEERLGQRQGLTEDEVVLRFLRDAVYYFMLNRDAKDHLQAIMSILKFSEKQREDVYRKRGGVH